MSTGAYGAAERAAMRAMAENLQAGTPVYWGVAGGVADELRKALPDLDDVTIGRVVSAMARQLHAVGLQDQDVPIAVLWSVLASTGLQMTEQEWKDQ